MISPVGVAQTEKETFINSPHGQAPDALAKYIMRLDGAWEAWLEQMVEDKIFNMQNSEANGRKRSREG